MQMPSTPSIENQPIRGLKRKEYEQLGALGAFDHERVELVFGQVVAMRPPGPEHSTSVSKVYEALLLKLAGRATLRCRLPFAATDDSEPQPDTYVTPLGDYWHEHPTRAYLVVEVAVSSLEYDRGEKSFLYGISHVDEYWIVDHDNGVIEVRRDRHEGEWRSIETFQRGDVIRMLAFPDVELAVSDVLPPL